MNKYDNNILLYLKDLGYEFEQSLVIYDQILKDDELFDELQYCSNHGLFKNPSLESNNISLIDLDELTCENQVEILKIMMNLKLNPEMTLQYLNENYNDFNKFIDDVNHLNDESISFN